jgi:GT2 family glycosyltransferase
MTTQEVAIVILNYNGREFLEKFLPSVITFSKGCRIIVADNASNDGSVDLIKKKFPEVETIVHHKNEGFCTGYNLALQHIKAKYYVLLNSDVEVSQNWLWPMYNLLEKNPTIAACQPKVLSYKDKAYFEYAGAGGGFIDFLGYPFCRGRIFEKLEKDTGQYNDTQQVFWATGACLFIKADIYHMVGGLDDDFFAHMEEIDLCWRIQSIGYQIYYQGNSTVYHVGGGTLSKNNPQKTYLNFRNSLIMLLKNLPKRELFWKFPARFLLDSLAVFWFLLTESPHHVWAIIRAYGDFVKKIEKYRKKRNRTLKKSLKQNNKPIYTGSIVLSYFIRRKTNFKEIFNIN